MQTKSFCAATPTTTNSHTRLTPGFKKLNLNKKMNVPNRCHNSGKEQKRKLKPQALRARKAALKALKRKLAG